MIKKLLFFVALFVCATIAAETLGDTHWTDAVHNGFVPSRSSPLVLRPRGYQNEDAMAVFVDESGEFLSSSSSSSSMAIEDVAEAMSRHLGIVSPRASAPSYQPSSSSSSSLSFVKSDLFTRPRATVLFNVHSVGQEVVQQQSLTGITSLASQHMSRDLSVDWYPYSTCSAAATLSTGLPPSIHGVVEDEWRQTTNSNKNNSNSKDVRVRAFVDGSESGAFVASVSDVVLQTWQGESLIISSSSSTPHALAFCPSSQLATDVPRTNTICTSVGSGSYSPVSSTSSSSSSSSVSGLFTKSRSQLLSSLSSSSLLAHSHDLLEITVSLQEATITVIYPTAIQSASAVSNNHRVIFDLTRPEQSAFWEELMYAETVVKALSSASITPLTHDASPDLITFSFASLTGIIESYGRMSGEFVGAVRVLDACIPLLMRSVLSAYDNRAVGHVVLMGSHPSILHPVDTRSLFSHLGRLIPLQRDVSSYYPLVYLDRETTNDDSRLREVCHVLSIELQHSGFKVYCPSLRRAVIVAPSDESSQQSEQQEQTKQQPAEPSSILRVGGPSASQILLQLQLQATTSATANTVVTYPVQHYQITLWLVVFLILVVIYIVYALAFMSFKKDTLLYSTFNPNWEERKRR